MSNFKTQQTFFVVIIKLTTQTIFKSSSLELKDWKVSDPKVMLRPEFAKKKSLRLKFVKVGIGHPPAQTPMSGWDYRIQWWRSRTLAGIKEKVKV